MGVPSHADKAGSEVIHCTSDAGMQNSLSHGANGVNPEAVAPFSFI